jgi:hypothetical protein
MNAATAKRKFAELIEALGNSFRPNAIIQFFLNSNGDPVPISTVDRLPVDAEVSFDTTGLATEAKQDTLIAKDLSTTSAITRPASSLSNQTLLADLSTRKGFIIVSEMGSGIAYIKLGETATTTDYSFPLLPGQIFNSSVLGCNYTGQVDFICDAVSGSLQVTSLNA